MGKPTGRNERERMSQNFEFGVSMRRFSSPCLQGACKRRCKRARCLLLPFRSHTVEICISALWLTSCTSLSPLRPNTTANPTNSVIAQDGYKVAFVEFGEQGSYQDPTQLQNALALIRDTPQPLGITYVHSWRNN